MHNLPMHNTYALLAIFLAPNKCKETHTALKEAIQNEELEWESLLLQANIQMCTPLWYARLKQDDLLQYLPQELQEYLEVIYEANEERNDALQSGLVELLSEFQKEGVKNILLKGASTFVDDLYGSSGARYMGDLDILVERDKLDSCESILEKLEYVEFIPEGVEPSMENDHHHINRYIKPGTPVAVEIHYKTGSGQIGRIVKLGGVWGNKEEVICEKQHTAIMSPTHRILLTTTHSLLQDREFLYGAISLRQLAEFSALAMRYRHDIDWGRWYQIALSNNLKSEFITYLTLAHDLMEVPWPEAIPCIPERGFHQGRILLKGGALSRVKDSPLEKNEYITRYLGRLYFVIKFPGWVWNNMFYTSTALDVPLIFYVLLKKSLRPKSWATLIGFFRHI